MGVAEDLEESFRKEKAKTMAVRLAETYERRAERYEQPPKKAEFYEKAAEKFFREGVFRESARCYSLAGRWSEKAGKGTEAAEFYDRSARLYESEAKKPGYRKDEKKALQSKADRAFSNLQRLEDMAEKLETVNAGKEEKPAA